ncbi:hypothetical protein BGZ63DRAFT_429654 [Mariannaea sp. PMI_226]|nr:hypothetical protein BGZ63DRAFT_429654 [Mariannaea sp. PMI_226]
MWAPSILLWDIREARIIAQRRQDLIFDKDLHDLTCDLADTLRELDDPASTEHHPRAEITRRDFG